MAAPCRWTKGLALCIMCMQGLWNKEDAHAYVVLGAVQHTVWSAAIGHLLKCTTLTGPLVTHFQNRLSASLFEFTALPVWWAGAQDCLVVSSNYINDQSDFEVALFAPVCRASVYQSLWSWREFGYLCLVQLILRWNLGAVGQLRVFFPVTCIALMSSRNL